MIGGGFHLFHLLLWIESFSICNGDLRWWYENMFDFVQILNWVRAFGSLCWCTNSAWCVRGELDEMRCIYLRRPNETCRRRRNSINIQINSFYSLFSRTDHKNWILIQITIILPIQQIKCHLKLARHDGCCRYFVATNERARTHTGVSGVAQVPQPILRMPTRTKQKNYPITMFRKRVVRTKSYSQSTSAKSNSCIFENFLGHQLVR